MSSFPESVVTAVTSHMNGDHPEDNVLIARAFGFPEATESTMTGLSNDAGVWRVVDPAGEHELTVPWPAGRISERPEIRREVVVLYNAACERLGYEPREQHAPSGGAHHGSNPHASNPHAAATDPTELAGSFAAVIRERSWPDHSDSEGAAFMDDIMRGEGTLQDYIDLVAQHFFVYEALEAAAEKLARDPAYADFHPESLVRLPAIERDLEQLIGADWRDRIEPVSATARYAERIREVDAEGWLPGILAHHYTRYLGDLSGGQMIAKRVSRQHGLSDGGAEFYHFSDLGELSAFKDEYRSGLDRLGAELDDEQRERMLDEVHGAYRFNTEIFEDLAAAKSGTEAGAAVPA